jgi:hypothetical protein
LASSFCWSPRVSSENGHDCDDRTARAATFRGSSRSILPSGADEVGFTSVPRKDASRDDTGVSRHHGFTLPTYTIPTVLPDPSARQASILLALSMEHAVAADAAVGVGAEEVTAPGEVRGRRALR